MLIYNVLNNIINKNQLNNIFKFFFKKKTW